VKRIAVVVVSALMCMLVVAFGAAAQEIPIDASKYVVTEIGDWTVEKTDAGLQVTQTLYETGADSYLYFEGITLPENFEFSTDIAYINHGQWKAFVGVVFNVLDYPRSNSLRFTHRGARYELLKYSSKAYREIASSPDPSWADKKDLAEWRTFKVIRRGDNIKLYINDQLIFETTDSTKGGTIGFYIYETAAVFRNIKLIAL